MTYNDMIKDILSLSQDELFHLKYVLSNLRDDINDNPNCPNQIYDTHDRLEQIITEFENLFKKSQIIFE